MVLTSTFRQGHIAFDGIAEGMKDNLKFKPGSLQDKLVLGKTVKAIKPKWNKIRKCKCVFQNAFDK